MPTTSTSTSTTTTSRTSKSFLALEPALKAYALGYAADALPALLKALVRFFSLEAKRLNTIRRNAKEKGKAKGELSADGELVEGKNDTTAAATTAGLRASDLFPTLYAIPTLLRALFKALTLSIGLSKSKSTSGLGYQLGMAPACALAILGWSLLNNTLNLLLPSGSLTSSQSGIRLGFGRELNRRHSEIVTCFLSSTIAATGALTLLQLNNQQQIPSSPLSANSDNNKFKDEASTSSTDTYEKQTSPRNQKLFSFLSASSPSSSHFFSSPSKNNKNGPGNRASERQVPKITPTPLAPGGHFLARLTSLSLGPFSNPSSPSNSRPQTPQLPSNGKDPNLKITPSRSHETIINQPIAKRGLEEFKEGELAAQLENALIKQQEKDAEELRLRNREPSANYSPRSTSTSPISTKQPLSTSSSSNENQTNLPSSIFIDNQKQKSKPSFTIDLTLFALVRGMDTLVRAAPLIANALARSNFRSNSKVTLSDSKLKGNSKSGVNTSILARLASGLASQAEGLVFVVCCAQIMWAWFYHPERLPPSYVRWISGLASMDHRLLRLLRALRSGKPYYWKYNDFSSETSECRDLAESLGYPIRWGDVTSLHNTKKDAQKAFAQAELERSQSLASDNENEKVDQDGLETGLRIQTNTLSAEGSSRKVKAKTNYSLSGASGPRGRGQMGGLPCEIVHCGMGGSSCLANAGLRWLKGFKVCMGIYVPVHLLPRLIFGFQAFVDKPGENFLKVLKGSSRSASFLATFIASIWFMVCFARTLVLPRIFDLPFNSWDSGLGPALGSFACGFAVFIEEKRKRAEMALYVAPRALFAVAESIKPGWLSEAKKSALWTERILFGFAVGIVMTSGKFRPDLLRGITSLMAWIVKDNPSKKPILISS